MLAIAFTFHSGRYHATPWDRHVNEGAVTWPPEPWRVVRALLSTWHHKVKRLGKHDESTLQDLVESLSRELPEYTLPPATHSHSRHYMPQREAGKTALVFDAFAALSTEEPLVMAWQEVCLSSEQTALLDDLLSVMGYLGRSESWVEASRFQAPFKANCRPLSNEGDHSADELPRGRISLLAPLAAADYYELRNSFLKEKESTKRLARTLPSRFLDALSAESSDLRDAGWSQPPASRKVLYLRPNDALRPQRYPQFTTPKRTCTARYVLIGKPLPRVEDTVRIGELFRRAVMSVAKRRLGEDSIPVSISGHGLPKDNRHRHAFYVPWDSSGDGRIDRLILHLPDGIDADIRKVAEDVRRLWSHNGAEWQLVLEDIATSEANGPLFVRSVEWESVTPYLHPWHVKKGFDVEAQIRRECALRGLPGPTELMPLPVIMVGGRPRHPRYFLRGRERRGLEQPDRHGSFWRIRFPDLVPGPVALGFACHFGLGLFRPVG